MTGNDIEKKIAKAVDNSVPEVLDRVLSKCDEGNVIRMEEKKNNGGFKLMASVAAAVLIMIGAVNFMGLGQAGSTVFLDVNPSVELTVNSMDRITEAKALNGDAAKIMYGMDLKNTDLEVGVNAIIGSMLKNGYLSDISNSILVSVDDNNEKRNAELQDKIAEEINEILTGAKLDAAVISQNVKDEDEAVRELCEKYGISKGKAELIYNIAEENPSLTYDKLAGLTINELNLIISDGDMDLEDIVSKGEPSSKKYIGEDKARETALSELGISLRDAKSVTVKLDSENNELVYEVEVIYGTTKYEIDVNALDGRITGRETSDISYDNEVQKGEKLTKSEIRDIIEEELKLSESDADKLYIREEEDEGRLIYKAKLMKGNYQYTVKLDAYTGRIIEREVKEVKPSFIENGKPQFGKLEASEAVKIVLDELDLPLSYAGRVDLELAREDGKLVLEAEISYDGTHYELLLDAETGKMINVEKSPAEVEDDLDEDDLDDKDDDIEDDDDDLDDEKDDEDDDDDEEESANYRISEEEAVRRALKSMGLRSADVKYIEAEKEVSNGRAIYEVSFVKDGTEYEITVDGKTGKILKSEKEAFEHHHTDECKKGCYYDDDDCRRRNHCEDHDD